jgi:hypothetical protein
MVMFTKGQLERMNATLDGPRKSFAQSMGLTPVGAERLVLEEESDRTAVALLAGGAEPGDQPQSVFDGVSWVPIE